MDIALHLTQALVLICHHLLTTTMTLARLSHTADTMGTVVVRYWYGKMGSALLDADLVCASREVAVPPDWRCDPFTLPKKIRGLAFGSFEDFDDNGAHPRARAQMVIPGARISNMFLNMRDPVLYGMGAQLFPTESRDEQRTHVSKRSLPALTWMTV